MFIHHQSTPISKLRQGAQRADEKRTSTRLTIDPSIGFMCVCVCLTHGMGSAHGIVSMGSVEMDMHEMEGAGVE